MEAFAQINSLASLVHRHSPPLCCDERSRQVSEQWEDGTALKKYLEEVQAHAPLQMMPLHLNLRKLYLCESRFIQNQGFSSSF